MRTREQSVEWNITDRLTLLRDAFDALKQCAELVSESNLPVEREAFNLLVARVGSRLVEIGLSGDDAHVKELRHWKEHAVNRCQQLITTIEDRPDKTIRASDIPMFVKAPPPMTIEAVDLFTSESTNEASHNG